MYKRHDITDAVWFKINSHLPGKDRLAKECIINPVIPSKKKDFTPKPYRAKIHLFIWPK